MGYVYKGTRQSVEDETPLIDLGPIEDEVAEATGCGEKKGSHAGYQRHQRRDEKACTACTNAHSNQTKSIKPERISADCGSEKGLEWHRSQKYKLCSLCRKYKEGRKA